MVLYTFRRRITKNIFMEAIYYRQRESPQNIIKNHGNLDITADYPLLITPPTALPLLGGNDSKPLTSE